MILVVGLSTLACLLAHVAVLNRTINSDETFYRAAAIAILNHSSCGTIDTIASLQPCNLEHPPLVKLLMAASMAVFGNGSLGVCLPSILAGLATIPVTSWLAWSLSKERRVVIATAVLVSTSPILFLLSSVGMLDSVELFFGLLGLAVYFSENKPGSTRLAISGILMGLSMLSKEVAVLLLAGLVAYLLRFGKGRDALWVLVSSSATTLVGLWIYDSLYTPFTNPIQHMEFILETGLRLTNQAGFAVSPVGWFFQDRGLLLALLTVLWVPLALLQVLWRRNREGGILPLGLFFLVFTLTPPVALYFLLHRQEYLFYDLQVLPSLVLGASGTVGLNRAPVLALLLLLSASVLLFVYSFSLPLSVFAFAKLRF